MLKGILTGVSVIKASVVNRGAGIGVLATVKKVTFLDGQKVQFSNVSFKRAWMERMKVWDGWSEPILYRGDVVQKDGTIIDSEEFDFTGTMIATKNYSRRGPLAVGKGISVNSFAGDIDFLSNAGLVKSIGENNLYSKEDFYGIYLMPLAIELANVGRQTINLSNSDINESDDTKTKIIKLYRALGLEAEIEKFDEKRMTNLIKIVKDIRVNRNEVTIELTEQEKKRRLEQLLKGMGDLYRRIEGRIEVISPLFCAFSLSYYAPNYLYLIEDEIVRQYKQMKENGESIFTLDYESLVKKLEELEKRNGKKIYKATYMDYNITVNELINDIFSEKDKQNEDQSLAT